MTAIRSIKKMFFAFSIALVLLFGVQVYFVLDPHHLMEGSGGAYEELLEQESLLQELTRIVDDLHGLQSPLVAQEDLDRYGELLGTSRSHVKQLEGICRTKEWTGAYQILQESQESYEKAFDVVLRNAKSFFVLRETLLTKSAKPIFNLLDEMKLLLQTKAEIQNVEKIRNLLSTLGGCVQRILGDAVNLEAIKVEELNGPMDSLPSALSVLLRVVENKPEARTEVERLQTLIMNYCATIHQIKTVLSERTQLSKRLLAQENLFVKLLTDLKIGLQESQKETFSDIYRNALSVKGKSLLFSGILILIALGFFVFLFFNLLQPLKKLPSILSNNEEKDLPPPSWEEIQEIFNSIHQLKIEIHQSVRASFRHAVQENSQKIDRKLTMLSNSAVELGKVSASISRIPKIFDQKFASIYKANDDARVHFRQMVYACEDMKKMLTQLIQQVEVNPSLLTPESFEGLKASVAQILGQAHEAAVESQTLGLRFGSLVRTKEGTLEVSRLFSKAGTRVNQLARSLQEDLKNFFEYIKKDASL